jgi:hypothetical protein
MIAKTSTCVAATLAVALLVPVAACSFDTGAASTAPTSQPSPTTISPEQKQKADIAAAEKTYRAFMAEVSRVEKDGGSQTATAAMKKYAAGTFLDRHAEALRQQKRRGFRYTSGPVIGSVELATYSPAQVELAVCEDNTKNKVVDKQGKVLATKGPIVERTVYVRSYGKTWLLWHFDGGTVVRSCAAG